MLSQLTIYVLVVTQGLNALPGRTSCVVLKLKDGCGLVWAWHYLPIATVIVSVTLFSSSDNITKTLYNIEVLNIRLSSTNTFTAQNLRVNIERHVQQVHA